MPSYEQRPTNPLNLLPPNDKHDFVHADEVPFEPNAKNRSFANAYWFAEASLMAYARPNDPDHAIKKISAAFSSPKAAGKNVAVSHGEGHVLGANWYFIASDAFNILIFRGSEIVGARWDAEQFSDAFEDWFVTDANTQRVPWVCNGKDCGTVHNGFHLAYDEVAKDLHAVIDGASRNVPLFITGHSLGGGMAALAACDLKAKGIESTVYTYGAPHVGNDGFVKACEGIPSYRFAISLDIVPRLPLRSHFHRGKHDTYLHNPTHGRRYSFTLRAARDEPMDQSSETYFLELAAHEIVAPLETIQGLLEGKLSGKALALIRPIVDHAPMLYSIAAYNDWLNNQKMLNGE